MTGSLGRTGKEIIDATLDPMAILEGDEFVAINRPYARLYGFPNSDDLIGQPWHHCYAESEHARFVQEIVPTVSDDGTWQGRIAGVHRDGSEFPLTLTASKLGDGAMLVVARDLTEREERARERRFLRTMFDALDDVFYVLDESGDIYLVNDHLLEITGYSGEEVDGIEGREFIPLEQHEYVPGLDVGVDEYDDQTVVLDIVTKDGKRLPHEFRGVTVTDEVTGEVYRCGTARDVTERLEHERRLQRQNDELETLNRINELLLTITRELIETPGRRTVERTVCDRIADSDLYGFAWIGERTSGSTEVTLRTVGGFDAEIPDAIPIDGRDDEAGAIATAFQTGEVQVTRFPGDTSDAAFWFDEAVEHDVRSVATIPLNHGDVIYGVLLVYADRIDAFSVLEQAGFAVLGETVGFVINAIENRNLLFADSIVELEFEISDPHLFVMRASDRFDCTLTLESYTASGPRRWLLYFRVDGVDPSAVVDRARGTPDIEDAEVLTTHAGERVLELVVTDPPLFKTLVAVGAKLRDCTVENGVGTFVVEAPRSADVRGVVEQVVAEFPDSTLLARRERERPIEDVERITRSAGDALTERQRQVIEVAYRTGYFEWPRERTAEEVASALGIAPSTFHGHLRKAERTLLSSLFDGQSDAG